jgi:hypothetical protein
VILDFRIQSRSVVFPWSTCPMIVTTGGRTGSTTSNPSNFGIQLNSSASSSAASRLTKLSGSNIMSSSISRKNYSAAFVGTLIRSARSPNEQLRGIEMCCFCFMADEKAS